MESGLASAQKHYGHTGRRRPGDQSA